MTSAKDLVRALAAATADVDPGECGPQQDCHDRVKLAIFFDGTGNNREADAADESWSNVARLFDAARDQADKAIYRRYISGIGTKHNRDDGSRWATLRDQDATGGATGWGADVRLESGDLIMSDRLEAAFRVAAERAGRETRALFEQNEAKGVDELAKALSRHRLIKSIDLSLFGFSRGAALARGFINRLLKECKREGGELTYKGVPIRFKFLGIFDTVASMGKPGRNDFDHIDLWLPSALEQCVHYVAAHELRYSFPVDLIRQNGGYPSGWKEEVFPGVHSDVGGGYAPMDQARNNALARVPLCAMFREATLAGVRLKDWQEVSTDVDLKPKFVIPESTQILYDAYMAQVAASGSVEQRMQAHMAQWYAYKRAVAASDVPSPDEVAYAEQAAVHQGRIDDLNAQIAALKPSLGTRLAEGMVRVTMMGYPAGDARDAQLAELARQRNEEQRKLDALRRGMRQVAGGEGDMAEEAAELRRKQESGEPLILTKVEGRNAPTVATVVGGPVVGAATALTMQRVRAFTSSEAEPWMLDAYYGPAPDPQVVRFLDTHLHDSKAAFLGGAEPWSYFRPRGVWESARKVPRRPSRMSQRVQRDANQALNRARAAHAISQLPPGARPPGW